MRLIEISQLETHRIQDNITIEELARRLHLPKSTVTTVLRRGTANARNLYKIKEYLKSLSSAA